MEIDLARKKLRGYLLHSQQTLEELLTRKAQLIGFNLNHDLEGKFLKSLNQIKPEEIREIAKYCDQNDWDSIWFSEHHFSHEGMEICPNPILLSSDISI